MIFELTGFRPAMKRTGILRRLAVTAAAFTGCLSLSACGEGGAETIADAGTTVVVVQPAPTASPTPVATPISAPTPSSTSGQTSGLGINLTGGTYYSNDPMFANLLIGSGWDPSGTDFDEKKPGSVDALGNPVILPGQQARRILTPPVSVINGTASQIVCTWDGKGKVVMGGAHWKPVFNANDLTFEWPGIKNGEGALAWLQIQSSDQSDRLRNFDCREKGVARNAVFAADYLESLKPYGLIRFMDLSGVNGNDPNPVWATRARVDGIGSPANGPGIAIEHMIALANHANADAWFNVPWNADDDYVRNMAQLVHDGMPGNRHVYVELGNEVWNYMFGVTNQAEKEGLAKGFASPRDRVEAMLMRYAENTSRVMRIWSKVFADRPGQLVRVSGTQSANPWVSEVILGAQGKLAPRRGCAGDRALFRPRPDPELRTGPDRFRQGRGAAGAAGAAGGRRRHAATGRGGEKVRQAANRLRGRAAPDRPQCRADRRAEPLAEDVRRVQGVSGRLEGQGERRDRAVQCHRPDRPVRRLGPARICRTAHRRNTQTARGAGLRRRQVNNAGPAQSRPRVEPPTISGA